ncbi:chondroadherin [Pelobates cultripes]|uniref:Chondroadherin-like protein n=1 Tax=Pelobates cultripes TaxID=61616 RepID=A0AAD1TM10_PELCU|nr:chondroadherin [Pelobates cultripes]
MIWIPSILLIICCMRLVESSRCPQTCICDNIRSSVICTNKNLTKVPASIPQFTKKLDLRSNDLKLIPGATFAFIPYLTYLNLQKCNIEMIQEGAFRGLGRLVYLNLGFNHIRFIYQESFDGLSSLQHLILEKNQLEEINPGAFSQLGFLNFLNLRDNFLVYLADMLFQGLQQVKWISLSNNMINVLANEAFAGLPNLRRLSLDHNELQYLPGEAFSRMSGLLKLELGWNPITFLGEEAVHMTSLKQLFLNNMALQDVSFRAFERSPQLSLIDLSNNQLRTIQVLTGMEKLNYLNMTGNAIRCDCHLSPFKEWADRLRLKVDLTCFGPGHIHGDHLDSLRAKDLKCDGHNVEEDYIISVPQEKNQSLCPESCDCKTDVKHATCDNKGLQEIPKGFPDETILLDLHKNLFNSVPRHIFSNMKNVISLHLQNCQIRELKLGALSGMKSLVYLYLSNNLVSGINQAVFQDTPNLGYLYLDHNRFSKIPTGTFRYLPNLFSLHMQHNSIATLTNNNMYGAKKLHWVYLTGNNISHIAPTAFRNIQNLKKLHLDDNLLTKVPTEALKGNPSIEELKLSNNPIRYIGNGAFLPISRSLKHLYLNNMGLEKISGDGFTGLGRGFKSLYLENNKLSNLPNMKNFNRLEVINLANNPFQCDCQLLALHRWINTLNLKVGATCASPATLKGQKVRSASLPACPSSTRINDDPR